MSRRTHLVPALALLTLSACRSVPLPPPETPPALVERSDAVPELGDAELRLKLAFPLSGVATLARNSLVLPQSPEFQRVTGPGDNPEVEASYASTLSGIDLKGSAQALRAVAHVDYHATLRARASTPFGRIWLTKGSAWGTPQQPGRISLTLDIQLRITPDWKLKGEAALSKVTLTAPATKKICSSGPFKLCIDGGVMEREIHRRLEAEVRRQVEAELSKLERGLAEQVPLRDAVESLWSGLLGAGAQVGLEPLALGVEGPRVAGEELALELRVRARALGPGEPSAPATPLPRATPSSNAAQLPLQVALPYAELGGRVVRKLPLSLPGSDASLTGLEVRGPAPEEGRFWLLAHVQREGQARALHLTARLQRQRATDLALKDVVFSEGSRAWLEATQLTEALQGRLGALHIELGGAFETRKAEIARALSGAAGLLMPLHLEGLSKLTLSGIYAGEGQLIVQGLAR